MQKESYLFLQFFFFFFQEKFEIILEYSRLLFWEAIM